MAWASRSSGTESKFDRRWLSSRACANAASTTSGRDAPMLFDQAIDVQSMYSRPSGVPDQRARRFGDDQARLAARRPSAQQGVTAGRQVFVAVAS